MNRLLRSTFSLILLLLSACSSTTNTIPPGAYETTVAEANIPAEFPAEFAPFLIGEWNVQLKEDGAFAVSRDGHIVSEGKYEATSDQLVISDEKGEMACIDPPEIATGTYKYEYSENGLKLTTVQDNCGGRNLVLTLHALTRK